MVGYASAQAIVRQRIDPRGQTSIEQGHDNRDKPLTTRDRLEIESF